MQSTKFKGDSFESLVYNGFKRLLEKQDVPGVTKYHEIFLHKKYISKTASTVLLNPDITIEVYPDSNTNSWCNLLVIECKNHSRKINNSIFHEFMGNLVSYPSSGVRGIMVSSVGFSQTVIEQAKAENIALVVASEDTKWDWVIKRQINNLSLNQVLYQVLLGNQCNPYPVVYSDCQFTTLPDVLHSVGLVMSNALQISYLKDEDIAKIVDNILSEASSLNANYIDRCMSIVAKDYRINFVEMEEDCLGICDFDKKIITINQKISKERENFTIAHELGHIVLHKTITNSIQSTSENQNSINSELNIGKSDITRMEYQANTFASYLLMPSRPFLVKVTELFKQYSITTGRLYLDHQSCNQRQCNIILGQIADHFIVSKEAVKVRMKKDQLLVEEDRMKTMRDILR